MSVLVLYVDFTTLDSDIRKSAYYSEVNKPNWWYPLIFNIPVIAVCSVSNLMSGVSHVLLLGRAHSFTIIVTY